HLAACTQPATEQAQAPATASDADAFVAQTNEELRTMTAEGSKAFWLQATHITPDSQLIASKYNEAFLTWVSAKVEESKNFNGLELSAETQRGINIVKLGTPMPAPSDPEKLSELAKLSSELEGIYGAGKYCPDGEDGKCLSLGQLSKIVQNPKDNSYEEILEAWIGWRSISPPMRDKYQRFAELMNEGAAELGYADTGVMWRSGYDMSAEEFDAEVERLWGQVSPLYEQLHCYVRDALADHHGEDKVSREGPIPAHLLGNMWAQEWANIYPLIEPYPGVSDLDVDAKLEGRRAAKEAELIAALDANPDAEDIVEARIKADDYIALEMVRSAEAFYTSMGMRELPESFWTNSLFIKPRDRDVLCHPSAWDMDMAGDVRIKMCIIPTYEDLSTVYHELGHLYYDLNYNVQPPIFQSGAHDGFHEAIGDTIVLAMTPEYLHSVGLIDNVAANEQAVINNQMKMALDKIAFLPFGKLVDQWRWRVFDGEITPDNYNAAWWELREQYQGVTPPVARDESDFDPGAKYHIPVNTPYTRYFLARILQFQFYKSLCDASGHEGPLHECSFYGSEVAGDRFKAMLSKGQSQAWQDTLYELTGTYEMDASPIIEYFQP
ncbi:MAG: M2 family metallopeptidase, partial [Gammaproteobacteria bacterium]|nr:M2 family metallopeptidase [Gammaproteobacteria bacterium]